MAIRYILGVILTCIGSGATSWWAGKYLPRKWLVLYLIALILALGILLQVKA